MSFSATPAIFNLNPYFGNDPLSYDDSSGPFQKYGGPSVDATGASLNFLVGSDGTTHPQKFQEGSSASVMEAGITDAYGKQGLQDHRGDNIVGNADFSCETESQNLYSRCSRNSVDGLFNVDNFSNTTEEEVPLLPTLPSSLENSSTALDAFTTTVGELSDAFAGTSALVENLAATVSRVSTTVDSVDAKVDGLHHKIDGFAGMMDEIIRRERLAMEKFGNFANLVDLPKRPVPFHIETKKTRTKRRCSD